MRLPTRTSLRTATLDDLPAIAALRESAGLGVQDWALRLAIEPANACCFAVTDGAGAVIGVGSGVAYPPLGVVGNMIVAEGHRRRGIGTGILEVVCDFLAEAGCVRLELNATDEGRPLYAAHGFEFTEPGYFVVVLRSAPLSASPDLGVAEGRAEDIASLVAFDAGRFGGERRALLEAAIADPRRPLLVARRGAAIAGYGWLRVDAERIGPWVADDPQAAAAILAEAFGRASEADSLQAGGMPTANATGLAWVRSLGMEPDPWDGRMARGPEVERREDTIYAAVAGALG